MTSYVRFIGRKYYTNYINWSLDAPFSTPPNTQQQTITKTMFTGNTKTTKLRRASYAREIGKGQGAVEGAFLVKLVLYEEASPRGSAHLVTLSLTNTPFTQITPKLIAFSCVDIN